MSVIASTSRSDRAGAEAVPFDHHHPLPAGSDPRGVLKLLPLLALYLAIILLTPRSDFGGDEGGYTRFATNLTRGYYSPPGEIDLWWGPGYPILLAPFALLKLPWSAAKFLNAFFLFFAAVYFYRALLLYLPSKYSLPLTCGFGLYPPGLRYVSYIMSESMVILLMAAIAYHVCMLARDPSRATKHQVLAGLGLGFLALTKVFYGWVILPSLILSGVLWLSYGRPPFLKHLVLVCGIAYLLCLPYLLYTFALTGKPFYWGTSGGISLYYMSTPFDQEYGDWGPTFSTRQRWLTYREELAGSQGEGSPELAANHVAVFEEISNLPNVVLQDDAFKKAAIENIRRRPIKYAMNWLCNLGRLFFDYPYSYRRQTPRTYFYALPNMFIVVLAVLSLVPLWRRRHTMPKELYALLTFAAIDVAGTSLISAQSRQFLVLVPILLLVSVVALAHAWHHRGGAIANPPASTTGELSSATV